MHKLYEQFLASGHIEYGSTIQSYTLKKAFQIEDLYSNEYRFALLSLKDCIEKHNYMCRTKDSNLQILSIDEMADFFMKNFRIFDGKCRNRIIAMVNSPYQELDKKEQTKHVHAIDMANRMRDSYKTLIKRFV